MSHCIWFRHDLRISANPALDAARKNSHQVMAIYTITPKTWQAHDWSPIKIKFVEEELARLTKELQAINISLYILQAETFKDLPTIFSLFFKQHQVTDLYLNRHYGLDERRCETALQTISPVKWHYFNGNWLLAPEKTLNQQNKPYHVFTAYKRNVLSQLPTSFESALGESTAEKSLRTFCKSNLLEYHTQRDFPDIDCTSHLSHYLAQGVLSPRQCVRVMMQSSGVHNILELLNFSGPATWLNELIWRDFYQHLVWHYPLLCKGDAFKPETDQLPWSENQTLFHAWCEGKTGFPLVDAGMRQLNQTGWMHNRLRMVTAMFLSKTLFIQWRWGERYFMQHLIDGDFAANNGGWQWCASTGTDATPYFRIFNPTTQSERFDPQGEFIKRYCPELSSLSGKDIHNPSPSQRKICNYPHPIVDYSDMRKRVILAFKGLGNGS